MRDFDFDFRLATGGGRRLGVTVMPLSDQLATYFAVKEGVLVSTVADDSPAAAAGLKAGDVITSVNGRRVSSAADVVEAVRDAQPGSSVEIRVMRERQEQTLTAKMPERPRPPVSGRARPV
jgi:S1-C subfamily serine protease